MKLVSVIVQSYNSEMTIERTLNSITAQTYSEIELIITDDKSNDNTLEVVSNWIEHNKGKLTSIKTVTTKVNTGIPGNNNRALKVATGDYVEFLAADDYLAPQAIERLTAYCEAHKDTIPISEVKLFSDDDNCDYASVEEYCRKSYDFATLTEVEQYRKLLIQNVIVAPSAAFYPKRLLEKLGGFDENYWIEDYPINIKILRNGYRFDFIDEPLIYYRISGGSIMGSGNTRVKKTEAKFFFEKRFWYMIQAGMVREALGQFRYWIHYWR